MYDARVKLFVYNEGVRAGVVTAINSLQWAPAWAGAGEIKLVCAATAENLALLAPGAVLYNPDTPALAAFVIAMELNSDKASMTVRGKFTLYRLHSRVAKGKTTVTDAAAGLVTVCRNNLRGLPVVIPDTIPFTAPCAETELAWCTLLDAAETLAQAGGYGVRCRFDAVTASETLELEQGTDRRPGQAGYYGYFSVRMQNLSGAEYTIDTSEYANVVLCGGEAPTETDTFTRYFCEVGDTATTGNARHELWVDASSVRHKYTVVNVDGSETEQTYTEEEYQAAVQRYARAALRAHLGTRSLKCTAADTLLVYGRDYDLGDRMPLRVEPFGLRASARVASVKLVYEHGGRTVQPVFDNMNFEEG